MSDLLPSLDTNTTAISLYSQLVPDNRKLRGTCHHPGRAIRNSASFSGSSTLSQFEEPRGKLPVRVGSRLDSRAYSRGNARFINQNEALEHLDTLTPHVFRRHSLRMHSRQLGEIEAQDLSTLITRRSIREENIKCRSFTYRRGHIDRSPMRAHDTLDDKETQS